MMMQLKDLCLYHLFTDKPSFPISYLHNLKSQWKAECLTYKMSSCQSAISPVGADET